SAPATKGTLVHAALERLFALPAEQRTLPAALTALDQAIDVIRTDPEFTELELEASIGDLRLRGIIDRLELDADGGLIVTDYKTGKVPHQNYEQGKLG